MSSRKKAPLSGPLLAPKGGASAADFPDSPSDPPATAVSPEEPPPADSTPKSILIVEDNDSNMALLCELLAVHGFSILAAWDGREALEMAWEHRPDLILMDIGLPAVSGLEITRRIKDDEELGSIPVIAVTAFVSEEDQEKIRACGCDDFVAKPISVSGLLETIGKFL